MDQRAPKKKWIKYACFQDPSLALLDMDIAEDTARSMTMSMEPAEAARSSMDAEAARPDDEGARNYAFGQGPSVAMTIEVNEIWESWKTVVATLDRWLGEYGI